MAESVWNINELNCAKKETLAIRLALFESEQQYLLNRCKGAKLYRIVSWNRHVVLSITQSL